MSGTTRSAVFDTARIKRVVGRFARAPQKLQHVDDEVAMLRLEVGAMRSEMASLHYAVSSVATAVDLSRDRRWTP